MIIPKRIINTTKEVKFILMYRAGVRVPTRARDFSLHHHVQNGSEAHPASYPMGKRALSLGVTRSGREADNSPSSSAGIKECVELYLCYPICLHGVVIS